jgi:kumamolisin
MAMAPDLQSVVVYEGGNPDSVLEAMVSPQGGNPPPSQLSASWSGWRASATTQMLYEMMTGQGQTFFVSAGDLRAVCFPSELGDDRALAFVTVVGGTILSMNGNGVSWLSETAASAGGGIEIGTTIPTYQIGLATLANGGSTVYRNIPDVAMVYNNVFYNDNGQAGVKGGTSAGAPLWAGFMALVNQQAKLSNLAPIGFLNPIIYSIGRLPHVYARDFNDITSGGSISLPGCAGFDAVSGYDLVTGWGTPKGELIYDLINPPVAPPTPPPGNASPDCARLNAEIQQAVSQVNEYTMALQSADTKERKQDIQQGINDATAQEAGLRLQYVNLGCTEPTPSPFPKPDQ